MRLTYYEFAIRSKLDRLHYAITKRKTSHRIFEKTKRKFYVTLNKFVIKIITKIKYK